MYLIGLDFGTTNFKALLYGADGKIVRQATVPTPTHYTAKGFAEYYPEELFERVLTILAALLDGFPHKDAIKALSFASMAETGVALDGHGKPLAPAIAWFDRRTMGIAEEIAKRYDPYEIYKIAGMQLSHVPSVCKIIWEKQHLPKIHKQTRQWVFVCNYLAYRLSGELCTDPSQACRSMAFDIYDGSWSKKICSWMDIDPNLFPPIRETGEPMGDLLPDISKKLGLKRSVRVVLGGHDHPCGALSTGLKENGIFINSSGTVDSVLTLIDPCNIDRGMFDLGIGCGRFFVPETYYAMGGIQSAGRSVQWFAENFFEEITERSEDRYQKMNDEIEVVSVGSDGVIFIPHLRGSIVPHQMPFARGGFLGLRETHGRGHMARAIYEGLSMEYRIILDRLEELLKTSFPDMRCFGGGSQNPSWIQIKAHVLNRPMIVYETKENTGLGAAILAGIGCGLYRDIENAFQQIHYKTSVIEPDADKAARYESLYHAVYRPMFQHLKQINRMIENHLSEDMNR